ncbi:hypothetical protein [Tissierella sp.]|uniref:hypothetical protein n=1 Tax=Tissierella sp. TaxID=41274 RepID=UPI002856A6A9|nr:hypothetical protein [Tissierella sp.]MDR7855189.1 hypothetical protein [Tissierella sp.]
MESNKRINKFQKYDLKESVGAFWVVMIIVNIFVYALASYTNSNSNVKFGPFIHDGDLFSIAGSNIMPILIFFIIYGITMYYEYFALALSFGVTRRDFYKSAIVDNFQVSLIFAFVQSVLQIIDKNVIESLGINPMVDFGIFNTSRDNIFFIILSLFTFFLVCASLSNLLGVLQYKFGYKFWIVFGIISLFGLVWENSFHLIANVLGIFSKIYLWIESIFSKFTIFPLGLLIIIISYTLGYLLIRRVDIRK